MSTTEGQIETTSNNILGLQAGEVIDGRIEIQRLIGYGGQGVVLQVKHLEWDRSLALKLPLPEVVESPKNRERYLQEAETWIRLGVHPHIVRCWFVKRVVGLPGLFLDLITGGSLEDKIYNKTLAPGQWEEILTVLLQVSEGLIHSHQMGVVHRDIKPENLLIRSDGTVCLTDFGLVKSFNSLEEEEEETGGTPVSRDSAVTGAGQFLGTPRYGAPEQWNKKMTIGPTTDIYALGVILFELISGRRPFDAPGEKLEPLELIQRHLHQPAPDPRHYNADVPKSLAKLALDCLAKDPSRRPQSASELVERLSEELLAVSSQQYSRPAPVPGGDRADLLNNAAASLYSLGKPGKSRELLQRGLLLQAGHPECLYNLVQLDRREGKISAVESLRRLRRANARYELALLCIEEGLGAKAIELLQNIPEEEKNGLLHRIEGDALMYAGKFSAARNAYDKAARTMPNDQATRLRRLIATQGKRELDGHLFFPSSKSCYKNRAPNPELEVLLNHTSNQLLGVNSEEIVALDLETETPVGHADRPPGSSPVEKAWVWEDRLLLQDRGAFELWDLTALEMLNRTPGRVLAATHNLKRLVLLTQDGLVYVDKNKGVSGQLQFPPGTKPSPHVKACFTPDEARMCVLTPNAQIAFVDSQFHVVPIPWPQALPYFEEICGFQFSSTGEIHYATRNGQLQGISIENKRVLYNHQLPFAPKRLQLDVTGRTLVVSSKEQFGILNERGELVFRGAGACTLDLTKQRCLARARGVLTLFELAPFRRVRSWTEKIPNPKSVYIGNNGRRAVTLDGEGEHHVWEVDEVNRVYERELLLTPGESYEQLITSFDTYLRWFQQALEQFKKGQLVDSYSSLCQARSVSGFLQAEEALELQWALCETLRRENLESIWERLSLTEINSTDLHAESRSLALGRRNRLTILKFTGSATETLFETDCSSTVMGLKFFSIAEGETALFVAERNGNLSLYKQSTWEKLEARDSELGLLRGIRFHEGAALLWSENGDLGVIDMASLHNIFYHHVAGLLDNVFLLSAERAVLTTNQGSHLLDFRKQKEKPALPINLDEPPGKLTFTAESKSAGLVYAGFSDGTLAIGELRSRKVVFAINAENGPVSHFALNLRLAVGVVVTATGGFTIFDLSSGEVLERFTGHSGYITSVTITEDGRYLCTHTDQGEFRLWELSWLLGDTTGSPTIDWLPRGAFGRLGKLFKI